MGPDTRARALRTTPAPDPERGPVPTPEKQPSPTFKAFARVFMELCETDRLGVNTRMNYDVHLRHYLIPALVRRRLDEVKPANIQRASRSLTSA